MTQFHKNVRSAGDAESDAPTAAPSDCEPAMPRTLPFANEVNAYIDKFDGRFINNVPTGGLL